MEFEAYLRLRHYPLCRLLTWIVWASSFHSAGKDPRNTHSHDPAAAFFDALSAASLNVLSCANFNEFLVALRAGVFAVALQQLAQKGDTLLHLQDGVRPLWYFLHSFLVLGIKWQELSVTVHRVASKILHSAVINIIWIFQLHFYIKRSRKY